MACKKEAALAFMTTMVSNGGPETVGEVVDWLIEEAKSGNVYLELATHIMSRTWAPSNEGTSMDSKMAELTATFMPFVKMFMKGEQSGMQSDSEPSSDPAPTVPVDPMEDVVSTVDTTAPPVNSGGGTLDTVLADVLRQAFSGGGARDTGGSGSCSTGTCGAGIKVDLGSDAGMGQLVDKLFKV